jgi:predicted nucleic acid-binding protein
MYRIAIDTNVLVSALLSNRGASHRLLRMVGDHRWQLNLSVPLVLEYEQTLKRVCTFCAPYFSLAAIAPRSKG